MSGPDAPGYDPAWLSVREGADAAARAAELVDPLRRHLAGRPELVIRDLGCGTGAMGRWLAGRLPGPQRWFLHDRDPDLLRRAVAGMPRAAADGSPIAVAPRLGDVTGLTARDLAGTAVVTASALLDLLTAQEVDGLAAACAGAGCAALFTLSVVGRVELTPADPLDAAVAAAFNAHQRRHADGRPLLGPDAADATAAAFVRHGVPVRQRPAPWRLDAARAALTEEWLRGWVAAAAAQDPGLAAAAYLDRRLAALEAGELRAVVGHTDLLALPAMPPPDPPDPPDPPASPDPPDPPAPPGP